MLGQQLTMLMPEYLRHLHRAGLKHYLETGTRHISWEAIELPGLHKNGEEIFLELSFGEYIRDGRHYFTGIARDISRRKRDEQRLILQHAITNIMAQATSLPEATPKLLEAICVTLGWDVGEFWLVDRSKNELERVATWHLPSAQVPSFLETHRKLQFARGVGVPGRIWASEAPVWMDEGNAQGTSVSGMSATQQSLINVFGFPVRLGTEVLGVIDFFSRKFQKPDPALYETMSVIGSQIGQFVQRKQAEEELLALLAREQEARFEAQAVTRQLAALQRVTDAALAHLSFDELFSELLDRIRDVLNVDTAAILLLEKEGDELVAWAAQGLEAEVEEGVRIPVGQGFAGRIIAEGKPIIISDTSQAELYNPLLREKGILSLLGVPLWIEGRPIGVLHVGTRQYARFTDDDLRLLQLVADRIALAMENARLFQLEKDARAEAERVNQVKEQFLAILSHELRTPLTPIMGWLHMIQRGGLPEPDVDQALSVVTKNTYTLKRLISDLLDMSAIVSGKMQLERTPLLLTEVLIEAIDSMQAYANDARVQLRSFIPEDARSWTIEGDRERLVQIFSNLLHNAIKFSPAGGRINVVCQAQQSEAIILVNDEGQGIPAEFLPYVFERFRQADGSRTRIHGGLGLGLALVKSFVEGHGGSVTAASEGPGKGSTFTIRLPFGLSGVPVAPTGADSEALVTTVPGRILIVEDQRDTLEMLVETFRQRGYEVVFCQLATEALELVEQTNFDLVVSDIAMPVMDGLTLIKTLRRSLDAQDLPAIALTGYASEADAQAALAAGFTMHLAKPVDPGELTRIAEDLLASRASNKT